MCLQKLAVCATLLLISVSTFQENIMPTLPKFELPFDLPRFELPRFDVPKFDLPKFDLPKVDLPDVELPSAEQVLAVLRDAAYAGTGLVVLTAERIAELQTKLIETLKTQLGQLATTR